MTDIFITQFGVEELKGVIDEIKLKISSESLKLNDQT